MRSVVANSGAGITFLAELSPVNSKAVKNRENHKSNSRPDRNANCNQSLQSNLLQGSERWAKRTPHV